MGGPTEPPPRVRCGCCGGEGTVELAGEYLETLVLLRAAGETWAARLAPALGCQATAANNRLAALERKGLAVSRRVGRRRLYRATTTDGGTRP